MSSAATQIAGQLATMSTAPYTTLQGSRQYQPLGSQDSEAYYTNQSSQPVRDRSVADQYDGAPVPPPRSSSQHQNPTQALSPPTTVPPETGVAASRYARQDTSGQGYMTGQREYTENPARDARDRTRNPVAELEDDRRELETSGASSNNPPPQLIRENSEVLNRIVVSDPRVDAQRMQERVAEAHPQPLDSDVTPVAGLGLVGSEHDEGGGRGGSARRQDYSRSASKKRDVQFGDYMLGQTLGEGEFGKVKLGWKKDGSSQVAIKLIRRETVATNPSRLPKIYREISILRDLAHPNIVRLHEMVETERHIGIILEYASGGELFDYILNHRYLKDPQARRLFAQLISGVGYLHKKGIVHRDLKLENLLLDQNRNIIITDFGFANTFDPSDELSDDIEYNLGNREFVKKFRLDRQDEKGMRRGDLMQTSCGSPCYAAPELVVSDSLYTGRKVDVWSCGVILYAMLAGYLPFDDDPANPEGDNINLLYKYITTTPLTFPEYVTPHARDLLRRILVADPRKRADLFEVARHSWLSEYHHVVSHITSSTTNVTEIANSTVPTHLSQENPILNRSASVREPQKTLNVSSPGRMGLPGSVVSPIIDSETSASKTRHTLQPEYVAPQTHTARGEAPPIVAAQQSNRTRTDPYDRSAPPSSFSKPLPHDPPVDGTPILADQQRMAPPPRPGRDVPRSVSDSTGAFGVPTTYQQVTQQTTRPSTGGSLTSAVGPGGNRSDVRLPSRGSYGQPVAPTVAATNVQGRVTQPKPGRYNISGPIPQSTYGLQPSSIGQPMTQPMPVRYDESSPSPPPGSGHHRRSSTLSGLGERLFGRSGSTKKQRPDSDASRQKNNKKYPPTSMRDPYPSDGQPRTSIDSKRSFSLGLGRKRSADLESQEGRSPGRFSLLPNQVSLRELMGRSRDPPLITGSALSDFVPPPALGGQSRPSTEQQRNVDYGNDGQHESRPRNDRSVSLRELMGKSRDPPLVTGTALSDFVPPPALGGQSRPSTERRRNVDYGNDGQLESQPRTDKVSNFSRPPQPQYQQQYQRSSDDVYGGTAVYAPNTQYQDQQPPTSYRPPPSQYQEDGNGQVGQRYPDGFNSGDQPRQSMQQARRGKGVLTKNNRKFTDAYDNEQGPTHHGGTSGAVKKVQDFFRRRGRARADSGYR